MTATAAQVTFHDLKNAADRNAGYALNNDLMDFIHDEAKTQVKQKLGDWRPLVIKEHKGAITIEAMVNLKGQSIYSITRNQDRTITFRTYGTETPDRWPNFSNPIWKRTLQSWTAAQLLAVTITHFGKTKTAADITNPNTHARITESINYLARTIVEQSVLPPEPAEGPRIQFKGQVSYKTVPAVANKLIKKHITNPDTKQLADKIYNSKFQTPTTTRDYNTVVKNFEIFKQLHSTCPIVLWYYCTQIDAREKKPIKLNHPGQVIEAVKNELQLSPAQWSYLARLYSHPIHNRDRNHNGQIQMATKALVDANCPKANINRLQLVFDMVYLHAKFQGVQWDQGDPWKAWTHAIGRFLADAKAKKEDLYGISDALQGHIRDNQPWGPGDWETLCTRSTRWHQEQLRIRTQEYKDAQEKTRQMTWDSKVQTFKDGDYEFQAVTNGPDLIDLGTRMRNCLANYCGDCNAGISRIFTVTRKDQLVAAGQLVKHLGQWNTGQLEGPRHTKVTPELKDSFEKLRAAYQKADIQ